ncbi:MAG: hypothetical protein WD377_07705 [Nitriliruptoraceae bacterium]
MNMPDAVTGLVRLPWRDALAALMADVSPPCVSIYLQTHRRGPAIRQDPPRLRASIGEAAAALETLDMRPAQVATFIEPVRKLLDDAPFWQHQDNGLALFLSARAAYRVSLPRLDGDMVVVGERFHLLPLVELCDDAHSVLVLALSAHRVRLFTADRFVIEEIAVPGLPDGIDDTRPEHVDQPALQLRRAAAGPSDAALFHGHGGVKDAAADQRTRYLQAVDRALRPVLARRDDPIVLAGDATLLAEFRAVTGPAHVIGELHGSPDRVSPSTLRDGAWRLRYPPIVAERRAAWEAYASAADTPRAIDEPAAIAAAAVDGRIQMLLVASAADHIRTDPEEFSWVNDAVVHTLQHGGDVQVLAGRDVHSGRLPAALLRYA